MKKLFFLNSILFFLVFFLFFESKALASQYFFEDDFGSLDQWDLLNGNWDYWSTVDNSVEARINTRYRVSALAPKDQFWNDVEEYEVSFDYISLDRADKNFALGMLPNAMTFYDFHFISTHLYVEDVRDGISIHSTAVPFSLEIGKKYQMRMVFSHEVIEFYIDDQLVFFTNENWPEPRIEGKFAMRITTGSNYPSTARYSNLKIRDLAANSFTYFRQDYPAWSAERYDTANLWATNTSIADWGCALSSAAMILDFYGHKKMPNGEDLNPKTLNQWLLSEEDGYVGNGLVNWLAVSRLSEILSEQDAYPKLEFSYFSGDSVEVVSKLQESLSVNQPQIAAIPGHFFVVDSFDGQDFSIKDPFYDYNFLSEREETPGSLRIFTPSFTDLSYFLLVLPVDFNYSFDGLDSFEIKESISHFDETTGDKFKLVYVRQPETASYSLELSWDFLELTSLDKMRFFSYQKSGELDSIDFSSEEFDFQNNNSLNLKFDYFKDGEDNFSYQIIKNELEPSPTIIPEDPSEEEKLVSFKDRINTALAEARLSFYLYYQLNQLVFNIESGNSVFSLLEKFLNFYDLDFETI
jgi:hypothetical protein